MLRVVIFSHPVKSMGEKKILLRYNVILRVRGLIEAKTWKKYTKKIYAFL